MRHIDLRSLLGMILLSTALLASPAQAKSEPCVDFWRKLMVVPVALFLPPGLPHLIAGQWFDRGWIYSSAYLLSEGAYYSKVRAGTAVDKDEGAKILRAYALSTAGGIDLLFYDNCGKPPSTPTQLGLVPYALSLPLSIVPGFGFGHLMQGRWTQQGWLFAGGEAAIVAGAIWAQEGALAMLLPWMLVKAWEFLDVTLAPWSSSSSRQLSFNAFALPHEGPRQEGDYWAGDALALGFQLDL